MAYLLNSARMSTATTGTGTVTLGSAVTGYATFAEAGAVNARQYSYTIEDGNDFEHGVGTYTSSGTTFSRDTVRLSKISGTAGTTKLTLSGTAQIYIAPLAEDLYVGPITPQGRLTLTSATPVLTSSATAQTTIYYTPYTGAGIPIYDGNQFINSVFAELSNATAQSSTGNAGPAAVTTNSNYDLFVWNNSGTLTLTRGPAWTSDTGRGTGAGTTELTRVNGIYLNNVAITNGPAASRGTYVGTVRSNGSSQIDFSLGSSASGGGASVLGVWNAYNRVNVSPLVQESTASWAYTTATWRSANNSTGNRISFVRGLNEDGITASYAALGLSTSSAAQTGLGVGLDSTSSPSGWTQTCYFASTSNNQIGGAAGYAGLPGLGFHYLQALENGDTNVVFNAANGKTLSGLSAMMRA